jgi:hypothetical protein
METAVFSAASLFHGADDSDDEQGMSIKATPTQPSSPPSPLRRSPRAPNGRCFLFCGVEDEMQVCAEGKKPAALEYEERAHDFPGMVWFHDSAALVLLWNPERLGPWLLAFSCFSLIFLVL